MITPRPYQDNAVQGVKDGFSKGLKRGLVCLATGGGKTVIFTEISRRTAEKGRKVLVLVDRKELASQTARTFIKMGVVCELVNDKTKRLHPSTRCFVGMVETVFRRLEKGKLEQLLDVDLIIIDECHKGNFSKLILDKLKHKHIIGFTATPVNSNPKDEEKHLNKLYQFFVEPTSINALIAQGNLCDSITLSLPPLQGKALKKRAGEYTEKSQLDFFEQNAKLVLSNLEEQYRKHTSKGRTLCFCVNISHAEEMAAYFAAKGYRTACVHSNLNKTERDAIIARYKAGEFDILTNCGILTTGFDDPETEVIILLRKTASMPLYFQMCGRGSRPTATKDKFYILDAMGNWEEHGRWNDPVDWRYIFEHPTEYFGKKSELKAYKTCKSCAALMPLSARVCSECNSEVELVQRQEQEEKKIAVELVEIKSILPDSIKKKMVGSTLRQQLSNLSPREILEYAQIKIKRRASSWAYMQIFHLWGLDGLFELAEQLGESKDWARKKKKHVDIILRNGRTRNNNSKR